MRQIEMTFVVIGLTMALSAGTAFAQTRVVWETVTPRVTTRVAAGDDPSETGDTHRVAALHGRLASLSRSDAQLYVVYLHALTSFAKLDHILGEVGSPNLWGRTDTREFLGSFLGDEASYEWLDLKTNGEFTIYADDGRQPGKNFLVIINGAGEVLGHRPMWGSIGDLASGE